MLSVHRRLALHARRMASLPTPKPRVVIIVGATATGKTQLALDIASAEGGEVVNADLVQMYRGLDVATAKLPVSERTGIPHHLFSFMDPTQPFNVQEFYALASAAIADITARGKLPIIVGGTLYYSQSLLRPSLLLGSDSEVAMARPPQGSPPAAELAAWYARLRSVDAVSAERLHPNDWRKISRALMAYDATGVPYSQQLLAKQAASVRDGLKPLTASRDTTPSSADMGGGGDPDLPSGPMSTLASDPEDGPFDCCILWLHIPDRAVHDRRLDARVDKMLAGGLLDEIRSLKAYLDTSSNRQMGARGATLSQDVPSELTVRLYHDLVRSAAGAAGGSEASLHGVAGAEGGAPEGLSVAAAAALSRRPDAAAEETLVATEAAGGEAPGPGDDGGHGMGTVGLLQAIGYKEFAAYLELMEREEGGREGPSAAPPVPGAGTLAGGGPDGSAAALVQGLSAMKAATRRYARKQDRWARNRFLLRGTPMLALDAEAAGVSAAEWAARVAAPSVSAVRAWLRDPGRRRWGAVLAELSRAEGGLPLGVVAHGPGCAPGASVASGGKGRSRAQRGAPPLQAILAAAAAPAPAGDAAAAAPVPPGPVSDAEAMLAWRKFRCDACDRTLDGPGEWQVHLGSRGHLRAVAWAATRARLQAERGIVLPPEGARGKRRRGAAAASAGDEGTGGACEVPRAQEQPAHAASTGGPTGPSEAAAAAAGETPPCPSAAGAPR